MGLFDGKVVWVTGAGTGIGKAGALMFAEEGATVALLGRRKARLEETAAEIGRRGGRSVVAPVDVGERGQVERVATQLLPASVLLLAALAGQLFEPLRPSSERDEPLDGN